ncbi:hypothetical protein HUJ05_000201 [Dendroctonus ponderosae]|nr:hypothetical protein HUJ05_000201 [Dendroctonus ponderosae]
MLSSSESSEYAATISSSTRSKFNSASSSIVSVSCSFSSGGFGLELDSIIFQETSMDMAQIESDIQKKLVGFCKLLPLHLNCWKATLAELQDPVRVLINFCEQLRFVEEASIDYIDNFISMQKALQLKILGCIEEELLTIKTHFEKLTRFNSDLKNRLAVLERATVDLDWDADSSVVKGSPTQPRLDYLLQMGYEFWLFFSEASKNMSSILKAPDIRDGKFSERLKQAFSLDLQPLEENNRIYLLLALTQYVSGDKNVA